MGKIIVKNAVVREPGFLYYIDSEGNVCKALMAKHKKKAVSVKKKVAPKKKILVKKKK